MGQHVGVLRAGEGRDVAVVLSEDDGAEGVAVGEVAPVVEPRRRVGDHHVGLGPDRLVHGPDEGRLGVVDRRLVPVDRCERRLLADDRVFGGVLVTDLQTIGADRCRLHADLAVAGVGPEEGEIDAGGVGRGGPVAHGRGPVLVVAQTEEAAMVHEELRLGVQIDIGPVGHVQPEAFEVEQERQLVAHEVRRARGPRLGVGAVERDGAGAVGERPPTLAVRAVVEAVAAPQVVGLPGRDAVLHDVRRHGGVVADGERDELLLAAVTDQLQEVATGQPVLRDVEREGGRPRTCDRADAGRDDRCALDLGRDEVGLDDEAATEPLVEAHPVGLDLDGLGGAADEHRHVVAGHRADLAGKTFEGVVGLVVVADPVQRARAWRSRRSARAPSAR